MSLSLSCSALIGALGCPSPSGEGEGEGEGTGEGEGEGGGTCITDFAITANTTLKASCSPYVVHDDFTVDSGAVVTIEPGVTVKFDHGTRFAVNNGKLVANGTQEKPITLTSSDASPAPGSWIGLVFGESTASGTSLAFVTVDHAGQTGYGVKGCLTLEQVGEGRVSVDNSALSACKQAGLVVHANAGDNPLASFTNNAFTSCDIGIDVDAEALDAVSALQTYSDVAFNQIEQGTLNRNETLSAQGGLPWVTTGDINVGGDSAAKLTVEAGAVVQFPRDSWLNAGDGAPASIVANGTTAAPITFESTDPNQAAGSWIGVRFGDAAGIDSALKHVVVLGAGQTGYGQRGCLSIFGNNAHAFTIEDSTFQACPSAGVSASQNGHSFASFKRNTFVDDLYGVWAPPTTAASVDASQIFTGIAENRIDGDTIDASLTFVGLPIPWHVVASDIDVDGSNNPILTLAAGATFLFDPGYWLSVGQSNSGGLVGAGTATSPVTIASADPGHAAGGFIGVVLGDGTLSGTKLDHVNVLGGGQTGYGQRGCLTLGAVLPGRVSVTGSTFGSCLQSGVAAVSDVTTFLSFSGNTFDNDVVGMWMQPNQLDTIDGNQSYTNGTAANQVEGGTVATNATWKGQSVPWHVLDDLLVDGAEAPFLTLQAGVKLAFSADTVLHIGGDLGGGLIAQGTATLPVIFDCFGNNPAPGKWVGIFFDAGTLTGSLLDFVNVKHAGESGLFPSAGAVMTGGLGVPLQITNSLFQGNANADIFLSCAAQLLANVLTGNILGLGQVLETNCN